MALSVTACGAKTKVSPQFAANNPRYLALLPIDAPPEISPDRLEYIRSNLRAELSQSDFYLLDDHFVRDVCRSAGCPERSELIKRHPIAAFAVLKLESNSENDFLLGYYNELSGTFTLESVEGAELLQVEYTAARKGGVIFQSGQVLQGLRESYDNYSDGSFKLLADNFVEEIVDEIPAEMTVERGADPEAREPEVDPLSDVKIYKVQLQPLSGRPAPTKVCIEGTPAGLASLVIDETRTNLREISPGTYCGIYWLNEDLQRRAEFELRNAFGVSDHESFPGQQS